MEINKNYEKKYLKYKNKYNQLKLEYGEQSGGIVYGAGTYVFFYPVKKQDNLLKYYDQSTGKLKGSTLTKGVFDVLTDYLGPESYWYQIDGNRDKDKKNFLIKSNKGTFSSNSEYNKAESLFKKIKDNFTQLNDSKLLEYINSKGRIIIENTIKGISDNSIILLNQDSISISSNNKCSGHLDKDIQQKLKDTLIEMYEKTEKYKIYNIIIVSTYSVGSKSTILRMFQTDDMNINANNYTTITLKDVTFTNS